MDDIVARLRKADIGWSGDAACVDAETAEEGAREIERLRAALQGIVGMFRDTKFGTVELDLPFYEVRDAARAALSV